jgi:hypothetical protein
LQRNVSAWIFYLKSVRRFIQHGLSILLVGKITAQNFRLQGPR